MRRRSHLGSKTTRRALIRLRHALATEKFRRWAINRGFSLIEKYNARLWHEWHALGCP